MNAITKMSAAITKGIDPTDEDLPPLPTPDVTDAMYYGLAGDVMRAACDDTEIHPGAAGLAFLSFASVALGRERFLQIGNDTHHARIYSVHVGRSALAGKGMALGLTRRVRAEIELQGDPLSGYVSGNLHDGGLSSREGLAWLIRDPSDAKDKDGSPVDFGVADKRLFVIEEELANVLKQSARDGNTLSSALRSAWDGHSLAPATKSNRTRATWPHIGVHACITPSELAASLDMRELTNGFANRFLFCWAERRGIVPFPPPTPDVLVLDFARRLREAINHAKVAGKVVASTGAREMFSTFYRQHRKGYNVSELVCGLIDRHPPYAWRLALVFALLDCADKIAEQHMRAALAWLDYCRESTIRIFSTATAEAEAVKAAELGRRILEEIGRAGGSIDREPLRLALGKPPKRDFDAAIRQLVDACEIEEKIIPREGGGRPLRRYMLDDNRRLARFGQAHSFGQIT